MTILFLVNQIEIVKMYKTLAYEVNSHLIKELKRNHELVQSKQYFNFVITKVEWVFV